jgi:hypothetical protein
LREAWRRRLEVRERSVVGGGGVTVQKVRRNSRLGWPELDDDDTDGTCLAGSSAASACIYRYILVVFVVTFTLDIYLIFRDAITAFDLM